MKTVTPVLSFLLLAFLGSAFHSLAWAKEPHDTALARLCAVYATAPQGYPTGKEYARPDTTVPFRWHFYHEGAIERFDDAQMIPHVDPYNPLEDKGVKAEPGSAVKFAFVAEHVTEGKQALKVDFPATAIKSGKAVVHIQAVAGGAAYSEYLRARGTFLTASCYGPHYRWIKMDVFHPGKSAVRVRVRGVPLILHSGQNVVAVKTADAVDRGRACDISSVSFEVTAPAEEVTLFLDNVRMEQEVPGVLSRRGRMLQFPGRSYPSTGNVPEGAPVVWPGFTPVDIKTLYTPEQKFGWTKPPATRKQVQQSFRSYENGLLWGYCTDHDCPLRIDLPNGRYGVFLFARPTPGLDGRYGLPGPKAGTVGLNGKEAVFFPARSAEELRRLNLSGEAWDYRPGACIWEQLFRPVFFPTPTVLTTEVTEGHLFVELPKSAELRALIVFPEADKVEALKELGRLNYLLAESFDVTHTWVKGAYAEKTRYIGHHAEMTHPETIPQRLQALKLTERDFQLGFMLFQRGLTEPVYPDTIPGPEEVLDELFCEAAPGQRECVTLGILPLSVKQGLQLSVTDLHTKDGKRIASAQVDVRLARHHQKTVILGHHNHDYNYLEHHLVRRPKLDLYPGAARRVYLDITVPAETPPGSYVGFVYLKAADGKELFGAALVVRVLPIRLQDPAVAFAANYTHPRLKDYGLNTFWASHDEAVQHGYKGYLVNLGADVIPAKEKQPPLAEGRSSKGPRGFIWGYWGTLGHGEFSEPFVDRLTKEVPGLNLLRWTIPTYVSWSTIADGQKRRSLLGGPRKGGLAVDLEADRKAGKEFWFHDVLGAASGDQAARFTHGFWLWRLGAAGRYTTLQRFGFNLDRPDGPYYSLWGIVAEGNNAPLMESLLDGTMNPSRNLVLIRAGIDDYRYVHTLESYIHRAETKMPTAASLKAAREFRDNLAAEIHIDLSRYYGIGYFDDGQLGVEYWDRLPGNPWSAAKFDEVRQQVAEHILVLKKVVGE